uniref:(northern house mosquito) hypothetical protein n=1 Tax=Culex pipiens TaxID=7175 RepID=A0A8D8NXC9_CULPI
MMILPFPSPAALHLRHRAATCMTWTWLPPATTNPLLLPPPPQRNHLLPAAETAVAVRVQVHPRAAAVQRVVRPKPILLRCRFAVAFLLRYQIEAPALRRCRPDRTSKRDAELLFSRGNYILQITIEGKTYIKRRESYQ